LLHVSKSIFSHLPDHKSPMLVGGLPYCLFAVGVVLWSRGKTNTVLQRAVWLLPLIFVPVCGISLCCFSLWQGARFSLADVTNSFRAKFESPFEKLLRDVVGNSSKVLRGKIKAASRHWAAFTSGGVHFSSVI
jgi:hypothetical protein